MRPEKAHLNKAFSNSSIRLVPALSSVRPACRIQSQYGTTKRLLNCFFPPNVAHASDFPAHFHRVPEVPGEDVPGASSDIGDRITSENKQRTPVPRSISRVSHRDGRVIERASRIKGME